MFIQPDSVAALIRYIRQQLESGRRDYAEYLRLVMDMQDSNPDDLLFQLEEDIRALQKQKSNSADLWLFSPEVDRIMRERSEQTVSMPSDEVINEVDIPDWENGENAPEEREQTSFSSLASDEQEDDTEDISNYTSAFRSPAALPPVTNEVPAPPIPASPGVSSSSSYEALFARLELVLKEREPDLVGAIKELDAIKQPASVLTPEQLERYRLLREDFEGRRRNIQATLYNEVIAIFDDSTRSLEDVIAALDRLLDPKITRDLEQEDAHNQRVTLAAQDWSFTKSERYLNYFEQHYNRLPANLNDRYEWLRTQRVRLDQIANAPATEVTFRAKQWSAKVASELDGLAATLQKVASRALDFAYVDTLLDFKSRDENIIIRDVLDPLERPIRIGDFIPKIRQEYALETLRLGKDNYFQLLGSEVGNNALKAALDNKPFTDLLRFQSKLSEEEIGKSIKLALINLHPTVYQAQFPDTPVTGNRSLDPDSLALDQPDQVTFRREYVALRDYLLPALLEFYNQIISANTDDLVSVYNLLRVWSHASVQQRAEDLEKKVIQNLDSKQTEHNLLYSAGDFWEFYYEEADFERYLGDQIDSLNSQPVLQIDLPTSHPYATRLAALKKNINTRIGEFENLRTVRSRLEAEVEFLKKQFVKIEERLKNQEDAGAIEQTLNSLRSRAEKMKQTYFYRTENIVAQFNRVARENDARRGSQQIVEEAGRLFDVARNTERERESDAAGLMLLWQNVVAKASRFERFPEDEDASASSGHLLYLYAQAKAYFFRAQTLSVERATERTRETYKAQTFYEQLNGVFDQASIEVRRILPATFIRELGEAIRVQLSRAEIAEQNQGKIERLSVDLDGKLDMTDYKLQVYLEYAETILQEISNSESDEDYQLAAESYYKGSFSELFDTELTAAINDFMSTDPPAYDKGHPIYMAFEWVNTNKLNLPNGAALRQRFQREYRKIAESAYVQYHQNASRSPEDPFDLPLSSSAYEHWFQIRDYGRNIGIADSEEDRKTAVVAAYYLLSTATRDDRRPDTVLLENYLDTIFGGTDIRTLNETQRKAINRVRERNTDYILRDGIVFSYARKLFQDIQRIVRLTDDLIEADAHAKSARQQVDMLKRSGLGSARMIGEMWTQRLDALEQFARHDYNRTRRIIREFNRAPSYVLPDERDTDWARRRFTEMKMHMKGLYEQLEGVVTGGIDLEAPARDARELKERLSLAIFFLESQNKTSQDKGSRIINDLGEGALQQILAQIQGEFRIAIQQMLPISVAKAEELISAMRDDMERTKSELQSAGIDPVTIKQFTDLFTYIDQTHSALSKVHKSIALGVDALHNVVSNQNAVNALDDWREAVVEEYGGDASNELTNAITASNIQFLAGVKGQEDYQPFSTSAYALSELLKIIRSKRKILREKFQLNQSTTDSGNHFKNIIADIRTIRDEIVAFNQVLALYYPALTFDIPLPFLRTNTAIIQMIDRQVEVSLLQSREFVDELRLLTGLEDRELEAWLVKWKGNKRTIAQISGLPDHLLIAILLRDRAERWTKFLNDLSVSYTKYYNEWIDVMLWYAYYEQLMNTLCNFTQTPNTAPLPDTETFRAVALNLGTHKVMYHPKGSYREIEREVIEYRQAATEFRMEVKRLIDTMGDIPLELEGAYRQTIDQMRVEERDINAAKLISLTAQFDQNQQQVNTLNLLLQVRNESLSLTDVFSQADAAMNIMVAELQMHLDNRDRLLGEDVFKRGLLYMKNHIEQIYLPLVEYGIEDLQRGLRQARRNNQPALRADLERAELVLKLLTHENMSQP